MWLLLNLVRITPCSEKVSSALFFKYNTQLGPPYQVLVDTNFINFSIKNKVCTTSLSSYTTRWSAAPATIDMRKFQQLLYLHARHPFQSMLVVNFGHSTTHMLYV
jgi:hypothetical protein